MKESPFGTQFSYFIERVLQMIKNEAPQRQKNLYSSGRPGPRGKELCPVQWGCEGGRSPLSPGGDEKPSQTERTLKNDGGGHSKVGSCVKTGAEAGSPGRLRNVSLAGWKALPEARLKIRAQRGRLGT